jgi:hypothetical protein
MRRCLERRTYFRRLARGPTGARICDEDAHQETTGRDVRSPQRQLHGWFPKGSDPRLQRPERGSENLRLQFFEQRFGGLQISAIEIGLECAVDASKRGTSLVVAAFARQVAGQTR